MEWIIGKRTHYTTRDHREKEKHRRGNLYKLCNCIFPMFKKYMDKNYERGSQIVTFYWNLYDFELDT